MIAYIYFIVTVIYHYVIFKKYDFSYSYHTKISIGIIVFISALSSNNITLAYHDLLTGKAYRYNSEMVLRFELIKNSHQKECVLPPLIHQPETIFSKEIIGLTNDKNNWKNLEIARYFRKKSIVVQPTDTLWTE